MRATYNMPDTAMANAFLAALVHLVGTPHRSTKVVLPIGIVDVGELELVLRALGGALAARTRHHRRRNHQSSNPAIGRPGSKVAHATQRN